MDVRSRTVRSVAEVQRAAEADVIRQLQGKLKVAGSLIVIERDLAERIAALLESEEGRK